MKSGFFIPALAAGSVIAASNSSQPGPYDRDEAIIPGIQWHECSSASSKAYQCGTYDVPLDWADPSKGKARLALARYPATVKLKSKRLGVLFVNPGGPGGSGVDFILGGAKGLSEQYFDGQYDIVSWDPRGVGQTWPRIDCFNGKDDKERFWSGSDSWNGMEVKGNFTNDDDTDPDVVAFWKEEPIMDKKYTAFGERCLKLNGDNLQFVGSAAGVRDMIAMAEELEGKGTDINFWGFSYGTILGAYLVNMFPDRVNRVIVDGVINPFVWSSEPAHHVWAHSIIDIDGEFAGFAAACALAGPRTCAIADTDSTEESILKWTQKLLDAAYDYKKAGGSFGSGDLTAAIFQAMYDPKGWGELATTLYAVAEEVFNPNSTTPANSTDSSLEKKKWNFKKRDTDTSDTAFHAITCADAIDARDVTTHDIFQSVVDTAKEVSQMFAANLGDPGFFCHKWPARAVERYSGPFNKEIKYPMVVIGNEFDPITPFAGAKVLADAMGDSAYLVKQDDFGHCSTRSHSKCTIGIVRAYLLKGTLPTDEQFCPTEQPLFVSTGVTKSSLKSAVVNAALDPNVPVPGIDKGDVSSSAADLRGQVEDLRATRQTLFIAIGALGAAFAFALIALAVGLIRGRGSGQKYQATPSGGRESVDTYVGSYAEGGKEYKDQH